MAAPCLGAFGAYKLAYSKYKNDLERLNAVQGGNYTKSVTWVNKRHDPLDLRSTAPVPFQKPKLTSTDNTHVPSYWIPPGDVRPQTYYDSRNSKYPSQPSTRCEEWSTLRQMLPSRGASLSRPQHNWGTGISYPPALSAGIKRKFYHINSPMTRYVDAMHVNDPMFRLH